LGNLLGTAQSAGDAARGVKSPRGRGVGPQDALPISVPSLYLCCGLGYRGRV